MVQASKTIEQQVYKFSQRYPQFEYSRKRHGSGSGAAATWIGNLKPSDKSPIYTIKIEYQLRHYPKVWVISHEMDLRVDHIFKADKSLCVFDSQEGAKEWGPEDYICDTIVPWTIEWLRLYELWKKTDIWFGPEAKHLPNNKETNSQH